MRDYSNRKRMQKELRKFLCDEGVELFVTLTPNSSEFTLRQLRSRLRKWDARVNRVALGKNGYKRIDDRIYWWAFPEKLGVNPHWHVLLRIGDAARKGLQERHPLTTENDLLRSSWTKFVAGGTVDIQRIWSPRGIKYATKRFDNPSSYENFVISKEFHPNH